jgi:hypothetical protein
LPTFTFEWVKGWRRSVIEIRKGVMAGEEKFLKGQDHSIGGFVAKGVRSGGVP